MPFDPSRVDCWIFDLDNTLYPPSTRLFDQIDQRMGLFIRELLCCDEMEARRVQKLYFHDHGTTLSGLMHYHATDPYEFLGFVHEIDMSPLAGAPRLADRLAALPGRKILFTNGDDAYAARVLAALDLSDSFEAMWDIHAMAYRPKPEPSAYIGMIQALGITPKPRSSSRTWPATSPRPRRSECRPSGSTSPPTGAIAPRTMRRST